MTRLINIKHFSLLMLVMLIMLIILFVYGISKESKFSVFLNSTLLVLMHVTMLIRAYATFKKKIEFDFAFGRIDFKVARTKLLIPLIHILSFSYFTICSYNVPKVVMAVYLSLLVVGSLINNLVLSKVFRKERLFVFFIKNNDLFLAEPLMNKRDLTELTEIIFDGFSEKIIFKFKHQFGINVRATSFSDGDILELFEILISKSKHNVVAPPNFKVS